MVISCYDTLETLPARIVYCKLLTHLRLPGVDAEWPEAVVRPHPRAFAGTGQAGRHLSRHAAAVGDGGGGEEGGVGEEAGQCGGRARYELHRLPPLPHPQHRHPVPIVPAQDHVTPGANTNNNESRCYAKP